MAMSPDRGNRRPAFPRPVRPLANFRILQGLSRNRFLARFLDRIAPALPAAAQEVIALFYSPSLDTHLPRLAGPLSYRNPVTGAAETVAPPGTLRPGRPAQRRLLPEN